WCLTDHVQLTDETFFLKAGESYFSPDGHMIIFQGTPRPEGDEPAEKHYGMYVVPATRGDNGNITGIEKPVLLSQPGSANTCGWFHPRGYKTGERYLLIYGSTITSPDDTASSGYQRGTSRYTWQFPNEMEVIGQEVTLNDSVWTPSETGVLWNRDGYDAEASWSTDDRHILYTRLKPGSDDGDLWIYDTQTETHTELIAEPGYDGGPFFSPDGTRICYRSDRRGDKALQLYIAELAFDNTGKVTGIAREIPITDNGHVNWAPFFTPDGSMLFYATSEVSHANYEVYAIDATGDNPPAERANVRITDARGFDGLPVFTPDGQWMMWTAQRGAMVEGETRPSSQLWAARIDLDAVKQRLKDNQEKLDDANFERSIQEGFDEFTPDGMEP
ncbi:MAG: TolB family protein, partial [Phycisphaerales bacterium]